MRLHTSHRGKLLEKNLEASTTHPKNAAGELLLARTILSSALSHNQSAVLWHILQCMLSRPSWSAGVSVTGSIAPGA